MAPAADQPPANLALHALIRRAGISHAGLAHRVNDLGARQGLALRYDKSSVTRWIGGKQPRGATPYLIAEALSAKLGQPIGPADCGFTVPEQPAIAVRAMTYPGEVGETLHTLAELGATDVSRRSLLGAMPFAAVALVDPQRRWLLHLLESRGPSLSAVADQSPASAVREMIGVFDEMDNRFGGAHARVSVVRYLTGEVVPMLQRRALPRPHRAELLAAAAKLAAMSGWMSYDTGEYGLAQAYMLQALRLCHEAGDRVLGGQILAGLSHLATNLGHPAEGEALARAGIATAHDTGSPLGLMRLHAMAARAHAAQGDERATTASLTAAEAALSASRGAANESAWVRYLDEPYLHAEAAHCFRDLHRPRQAQRASRLSVTANTQRGRRQAISQAVLATAHLQQGELDAAVAAATDALPMLGRIHSERSVQALRDFRRRLAPHTREPAVTRFESAARDILGAA